MGIEPFQLYIFGTTKLNVQLLMHVCFSLQCVCPRSNISVIVSDNTCVCAIYTSYKMFTKEQLINIGEEKLADIILFLYQNSPDNQKQIEDILAGIDSDPESNIPIKEEIASLKRSSDFIDYYESDSLADEINQIRIHIIEDILPKTPNQAIQLLLSLLDSHENSIGRADDSDGAIGDVFKQACADLGKAYECVTSSVEEKVKLVYDRFMNNNYGVYDSIICNFKDVLGDEGLRQLKQKLEQSFNQEDATTIKIGLESIADCQNNVDAYVQACSFTGELRAHDHLEIARRFIKHCRGKEAIQWLDSMELSIAHFWEEDKMALKIQALDLCENYKAAQAERQKWFDIELSPKVYNEILKHGEADFIESLKSTAIQKAFKFSDAHVALNFLKEIKEFEQAAKLVYQKIDTLKGGDDYTLRSVADILCKIDPLAATLLYRKMIELPFESTKSEYYRYAAKDLAACHSLSSKITDWKGYKNHQLYVEELSLLHKKKPSFWRQYTSSLNEPMAKKSK